MTGQDDWVSTLRGIIKQMAGSGVTDLELHRGEVKVKLRRAPDAAQRPHAPALGPVSAGQAVNAAHRVTAPLTGIYYSAPSPTSRAYAEVGDWVEPNSVVGLIETMKVFNEVTAECQGRVVSIQVQQGQLVHADETILLVDVTATPDQTSKVVP